MARDKSVARVQQLIQELLSLELHHRRRGGLGPTGRDHFEQVLDDTKEHGIARLRNGTDRAPVLGQFRQGREQLLHNGNLVPRPVQLRG